MRRSPTRNDIFKVKKSPSMVEYCIVGGKRCRGGARGGARDSGVHRRGRLLAMRRVDAV